MANENTEPNAITWTASEYIDHYRGVLWYLMLVIGTAALAGLIYLITRDYFAAGTTVMVGIIIASVARWKPRQVEYRLSPRGFRVGDKHYSFAQFKSFSVIQEGQLRSLALFPIKRFAPPITAFIDEAEEEGIVDLIGEHLPMEEATPDRIDRLSRRLRF
jgi:uncharacterized protein (DUF486 family)